MEKVIAWKLSRYRKVTEGNHENSKVVTQKNTDIYRVSNHFFEKVTKVTDFFKKIFSEQKNLEKWVTWLPKCS